MQPLAKGILGTGSLFFNMVTSSLPRIPPPGCFLQMGQKPTSQSDLVLSSPSLQERVSSYCETSSCYTCVLDCLRELSDL